MVVTCARVTTAYLCKWESLKTTEIEDLWNRKRKFLKVKRKKYRLLQKLEIDLSKTKFSLSTVYEGKCMVWQFVNLVFEQQNSFVFPFVCD